MQEDKGSPGLARLPKVPDARLDALFRIGEQIWAEREDVRARCQTVKSWDFWKWLLWHGTEEYVDVRNLYAFPDDHLIHRVIGHTSSRREYLQGGVVDATQIRLRLIEAGFDFDRGGCVLDFGCGSGRILQVLARHADTCMLYGADVDKGAIYWCDAQLKFARAVLLPQQPPCAFSDGRFDAVYAFSVFSHLPEDRHRLWLEELHRITKPGAALVLTIQGRKVIAEYVSGRRPGDFPPAEVLRHDLPDIERSGVRFYPYKRLRFQDKRNQREFDTWDLESYGSMFILEPYVRKRWLNLFEFVALHEAPNEWQDYVLLRRR